MAASLFDAIIRHQIYVEGLKRGQSANLAQTLLKLNTQIKAEFANVEYANMGDLTKLKLHQLVGRLKELADTVFNAWLNELIAWLERFMQTECELLPRIFAATSQNVEEDDFKDRDDGGALWGVLKNSVIPGAGVLLLPFLQGFAMQSTTRILSITNMAYANRSTVPQTLAAILGAPIADRMGGQDGGRPGAGGGQSGAAGQGGGVGAPPPVNTANGGALGVMQRQGKAVTNTILQHISTQTQFEISSEAFEKYRWCSVIDERTSEICFERNGKIYVYGLGPVPPAHINCRSSIVPYDGSGPGDIPSFAMWASGQPSQFWEDAFDGARSSQYEGSRALSLEEFAKKFGLITA